MPQCRLTQSSVHSSLRSAGIGYRQWSGLYQGRVFVRSVALNSTGFSARRRLPGASKRRGSRLRRRLRSFADRKTLTWERVDYTVPVPGGTCWLLHEVYGHVKRTLTPLMSTSCAGKTTCLDVLAQRKNIGVASSNILVNGGSLGNEFARGTTYAERADVHEGTATVRQATRFSACLRQLCHVPKERVAYIEEVMEPLELQPLVDAVVLSLSSSLLSSSVPFYLPFRSPSCSTRAPDNRPYDFPWCQDRLPRFFHSRYGCDDLHRAPRA